MSTVQDDGSYPPNFRDSSLRNRTSSASDRAKVLWKGASVRVVAAVRLARTRRNDLVPCCSCCVCLPDPEDKNDGVPRFCFKNKWVCLLHPEHPILAKSKVRRGRKNSCKEQCLQSNTLTHRFAPLAPHRMGPPPLRVPSLLFAVRPDVQQHRVQVL